KPIYNADNEFTFYASNTTRSTFNDLFFGLQRIGNLPVPLKQIKAKLNFATITPGQPFTLSGTDGRVKVDTYQLNHQGVTLGYKVTYGEHSACIITDNAPIANANYLGEGMKERAGPDQKAFEAQFDKGLVDF